MEILLFIITRPILATWWARAVIVAVAASAVLNICPALPWLKDIKPNRINARLVGYTGLTLALAVWAAFNPAARSWTVFKGWVIIAVITLVPNTLAHWRAESVGDKDNPASGGGADAHPQAVILLPMEECAKILDHLVDPRRDLTIALEAINSANLKARQIMARMPDQTSGQIWFVSLRETLGTAEERVSQTRDRYEQLWKAVSGAWHTLNDTRQQQGLGLTMEC
jgi:hypothetical protein